MSLVTVEQVADFYGITHATVYRWIREGLPIAQRGGKGKSAHKLSSADVAKWREDKAVFAATGNTDQTSIDEAKRRKLAAEAGIAEIALAKEKGLVADLKEVEKEISGQFAELNSRLRKVPERCVLQLIGEKDQSRIKQVILDEIDASLEELSLHET